MNPTRIQVPLTLLASISFIVILIYVALGFYAYPAADDFCMASGVRQQGLLQHLWNHYFEWSGRYSGNAFYALYPLLFGLFNGYEVMPLILLVLLFLSCAYFLSRLFNIGMHSGPLLLISLCYVALFVLGIRHTASSLYWMSGAMTYQSANILLLLTLGLMVDLRDRQRQQQAVKRVWTGLCLAVILGMGSNENNMITLLGLLLLGVLWNRHRSWQQLRPWLALLMIAALCFCIVFFSPGNSIREATFAQRHDWAHAIAGSLRMGWWTLGAWVLNPLFIIASLLMLAGIPWLHAQSARNFRPDRRFILVTALITLTMPFILQFPAWWSMGSWPPPRTVDAIYFVFLLSWSVLLGAISLAYAPHKRLPGWIRPYPSGLLTLLAVLLVIAVLINSRFQRAYNDLTENVIAFQQYIEDRHQRINAALQDQRLFLQVPVYRQAYPRSIFFNDIRDDYRDWRNKCYAEYFGIAAIQREALPAQNRSSEK